MQKIALILHGWPDFNMKFHFLKIHLESMGYKVIIPNLFDFNKHFRLEDTVDSIKRVTGKVNPDVIIGISFGGFVLPHVVRKYPKTKLIFIATGPFFKPISPIFEFFLKVSKFKLSVSFANFLLSLPDWIVEWFYTHTYLFRGNSQAEEIYKKDMVRNLGYIRRLPVEKDIEILKYVSSADNSNLLKKLKNRSLIFASKNDHFMPIQVSKSLNEYLVNSKFIIKDGEHFNVFEKRDLKTVDEFLNI